jgi:pimeloyl-ACP methyl ester carboxylesterase
MEHARRNQGLGGRLRLGRLIAVLLLYGGLLLGHVPALAQSFQPSTQDVKCWMELPSGKREGADVQCGYLIVPETRSDPDSRKIKLAYVILKASGSVRKPDAIVYLAGGPGGNAVADLDAWIGLKYLQGRDLVLLDQRGTGYSLPNMNCPEIERDDEDGVPACRARLLQAGVDLDSYNSAASAADLADLRQALGYAEWNLYGISYGTRLALTIMRDHPAGIRSVILDSVYPPEINFWEEYGQNIQAIFARLFNGCSASRVCDATYPNLKKVFYDTVDRLNAKPARYTIKNPETGEEEETTLSGDALIDRIFELLYRTHTIPQLPRVIYAVANGDYAALDELDDRPLDAHHAEDISHSEGMRLSVECKEEIPFADEQRALANVPGTPRALYLNSVHYIRETFERCRIWGVQPADPTEAQPVYSDIPTLVMAGKYDPITPPKWAALAASRLSRGYSFVVPNAGHGAVDSGDCPTDMAAAFLDDPTRRPDATCLTLLRGPIFDQGNS